MKKTSTSTKTYTTAKVPNTAKTYSTAKTYGTAKASSTAKAAPKAKAAKITAARAAAPSPQAKPAKKTRRPSDAFKTQVLPPQGVQYILTNDYCNCECGGAATVPSKEQKPTLEEIRSRIELEAYLLAEKDGFRGNPGDYWAEAERRITATC